MQVSRICRKFTAEDAIPIAEVSPDKSMDVYFEKDAGSVPGLQRTALSRPVVSRPDLSLTEL
jgi:hypothetical protein